MITLGVALALLWQSKIFIVRKIPIEFTETELGPGETRDENITQELKKRIEAKVADFMQHKIWEIDLGHIRTLITGDEWIKNVKIVRAYPNEIQIKVTPKNAELLLLSSRGKLLPVTDDAAILSPLAPSLLPDVPILRGENFINNLSLRKRAVELITVLPEKGLLSRRNVAEISYNSESGYSLMLISPKVEVKMGEEKTQLKVARVSQVLDYLTANHLKSRVIDASFSKKVLVRLRKAP